MNLFGVLMKIVHRSAGTEDGLSDVKRLVLHAYSTEALSTEECFRYLQDGVFFGDGRGFWSPVQTTNYVFFVFLYVDSSY